MAMCYHCGDKSFKTEVKGQFALGHVKGSTIIGTTMDITNEDGTIVQNIVVRTAKGDQNA